MRGFLNDHGCHLLPELAVELVLIVFRVERIIRADELQQRHIGAAPVIGQRDRLRGVELHLQRR